MTARSDLTGNFDVVADDGRTRQAGERGKRAVFSDAAVVADLHQIVDLRAGADSRASGLRAVDAGVRADFDVVVEHDVADLRNALEPAVDERPAEAFAADHASRMQHDAISDNAALP